MKYDNMDEKINNLPMLPTIVVKLMTLSPQDNAYFDKVLEFIENVKEFGCRIAIDDFGTGYSNFEYLLQLKADYIKIDGSMIKNIDKDSDAKIVVSTIVDFAKKMNIKTIAEFVKDDKIQSIVKDMGIDYSQGFYFSEPTQELKKDTII